MVHLLWVLGDGCLDRNALALLVRLSTRAAKTRVDGVATSGGCGCPTTSPSSGLHDIVTAPSHLTTIRHHADKGAPAVRMLLGAES